MYCCCAHELSNSELALEYRNRNHNRLPQKENRPGEKYMESKNEDAMGSGSGTPTRVKPFQQLPYL